MSGSRQLRVNRAAHIPHLLLSVGFLVVGIWMVTNPETNMIWRREDLVRIAGIAGIALGVYGTFIAVRMLIVQPGLELTPESLVVRATHPRSRTVPWDELVAIKHGPSYVVLGLRSGSNVYMSAFLEGVALRGAGGSIARLITDYAKELDDTPSDQRGIADSREGDTGPG